MRPGKIDFNISHSYHRQCGLRRLGIRMVSSNEKLCLKWNEFHQNIVTSYHEIRKNTDFSDITLVCEDDTQVYAHRVILSACSPFFMKLLKKNAHPNPIIYMRGLRTNELNALVDFIYHGEVSIYQEHLDDFLKLAEEMQLKGLSGGNSKVEEPRCDVTLEHNVKVTPKKLSSKQPTIFKTSKDELSVFFANDESSFDQRSFSKIENINSSMVSVEDLDLQINSMIQPNESSTGWICMVCGKIAKKTHMITHIEANHIEGVKHPCNLCGKFSR